MGILNNEAEPKTNTEILEATEKELAYGNLTHSDQNIFRKSSYLQILFGGGEIENSARERPQDKVEFNKRLSNRLSAGLMYHEALLKSYSQLLKRIEEAADPEGILIDWLESWHASLMMEATADNAKFMPASLAGELQTLIADLRHEGIFIRPLKCQAMYKDHVRYKKYGNEVAI